MTDRLDPLEAIRLARELYSRWVSQADEKGSAPSDVARWKQRVEGLDDAAAELTKLRAWARPIPARYGDLSDLPAELLAQLSGVKTDELEDQIYAAVKASGEEIELDRLLIELFRRHGDVHERRFLNNKSYRMVQKGLIYQVPGRKGVYTTIPPIEDQVTPLDDAEEVIG